MGAVITAVIVGASVAAAAGGTQIGMGMSRSAKARREQQERMKNLEGIRYSDETQDYYNMLAQRSKEGLPSEQLDAARMGADRSGALALGAMGDRRAGLMGIGQVQGGLSDAYRQIAMADAQQRMVNEQAFIAETGNRGMQSYNEKMGIENMYLADARTRRREGQQMLQAGMQTVANAGGALATGMQGMGGGKSTPQDTPLSMQGKDAGLIPTSQLSLDTSRYIDDVTPTRAPLSISALDSFPEQPVSGLAPRGASTHDAFVRNNMSFFKPLF